MATRVHVTAARTDDVAAFVRRLGVEPAQTGGWLLGLDSVWRTGTDAATWGAALLSREKRCLVYRATTVDDAYVDIEAFRDGESVARFDHPYGGDAEDPSAAARADALVAVAAGAGVRPDRERLRRILTGAQQEAVGDGTEDEAEDELAGLGGLPDILEAAGVEGLRAHLLREAERDHEPPHRPEAPPRKRPRGTVRMLGCSVPLLLVLAGATGGAWKGGPLGALGGAFLALLVVLLPVAILVGRGILGLRRLYRSFQDAGNAPGLDELPADVKARAAPLLDRWRVIGGRLDGASRSRGILRRLHPREGGAGEAELGIVRLAGEEGGLAAVDAQLRRLWVGVLDAELSGAPAGALAKERASLARALARVAAAEEPVENT